MSAAKRARPYGDTLRPASPDEAAKGEETPTSGNGTCPGPALVFVVPMPENYTNRRSGTGHWRHAHNDKRSYWKLLDVIQYATAHALGYEGCAIPLPPDTPILRVTVSAAYTLRGGMDDENAAARAKPLLDWLVSRGYIATDRRERKRDGACCRWAAFPTQHVTRKEPARITLTLRPR